MSGLSRSDSSVCFCRSSSCSRSDLRSARPATSSISKIEQQRDVVFVRIVLVQEIIDALEQILEPQQGAHALAQRILVTDHGDVRTVSGS